MAEVKWPEVTRALKEERHELTLSDADVAERLKAQGRLDMRIFQIKNLNFLEISNTGLDVIPDEIGNLKSMKNLALQRNQIKNVPSSIGSLKKLKFLDLSSNEIIEIPETLREATELHTLNVSCNQLEKLPCVDTLENLVIFYMSHNKLDSFPEGIHKLSNLGQLYASNNLITEIFPEVSEMPNLKVLDVSGNRLDKLPVELADCPRLKDLNVKENPLKDNRLKKMTSQCNTRAIIEYIIQHSGEHGKGKKGKKKGKGKQLAKEDKEDESNVKKLHVIHVSKDENNILYKSVMKGVRPFIVAAVVKNIDLSDLQMYKKFIAIQTKLHDTECGSRTTATIATHNAASFAFPLTFDARKPEEILIQPLGGSTEVSAVDFVASLKQKKEVEERKKKKQQQSGIHKYLDLIECKELYPCLISEETVISLPPITNSEKTKVSPSICDVLIEVTSTASLPLCKTIMETFIKQLFQSGFISSPYATLAAEVDMPEKQPMKGLVIQQVRVVNDDNGESRVVFPSKVDLKFDDNIPVFFKD
eukprot:gene17534-19284_t